MNLSANFTEKELLEYLLKIRDDRTLSLSIRNAAHSHHTKITINGFMAMNDAREWYEQYITNHSPVKIVTLPEQARDYMFSTGIPISKRSDVSDRIIFEYGNRDVDIMQDDNGKSWLCIYDDQGIFFNGFFENLEQFKLLLHLTSVRAPV